MTDVAPGMDIKRDIPDQATTPLRVAADVRTMDAALFRQDLIGLML